MNNNRAQVCICGHNKFSHQKFERMFGGAVLIAPCNIENCECDLFTLKSDSGYPQRSKSKHEKQWS